MSTDRQTQLRQAGRTCRVRGEAFYLGVFDTAEEAFSFYVSAKREMHEGCTL